MERSAARSRAPTPEKRTALAWRPLTSKPEASTARNAGVQRAGSAMISRALRTTAIVFGCCGYLHMTTPQKRQRRLDGAALRCHHSFSRWRFLPMCRSCVSSWPFCLRRSRACLRNSRFSSAVAASASGASTSRAAAAPPRIASRSFRSCVDAHCPLSLRMRRHVCFDLMADTDPSEIKTLAQC